MDLIMLKAIQVKEMIEKNQFDLIIDLRDNENYHKGHLPGAINIPINEIPDKLNFLDLYKKKSIILYCGIGSKSVSVGKVLIINGFEKIYSLSNGIKGYKYELKLN